jgi:hypothetical protein
MLPLSEDEPIAAESAHVPISPASSVSGYASRRGAVYNSLRTRSLLFLYLRYQNEPNGVRDSRRGYVRGEIESASDSEIVFVQFVTPNATLRYMRKDGAVDVKTDKLIRSLVNCVSAPARDILSKWEFLR